MKVGRYEFIHATIMEVAEGTGSAAGRVVNLKVRVLGEKGIMQVSCWDNDTTYSIYKRMQVLSRRGTLAKSHMVLKIRRDETDKMKAYAYDFSFGKRLFITRQDEQEYQILHSLVCNPKFGRTNDGRGKFLAVTPVYRKGEPNNVIWYYLMSIDNGKNPIFSDLKGAFNDGERKEALMRIVKTEEFIRPDNGQKGVRCYLAGMELCE